VALTRSIELRTSVPGPRSAEILARNERVVASPLAPTFPIVAAQASGATLTDVDCNTFTHTDFTIVPYETYTELAERLLARTPISGPTKAAFFNAGTEAVENAVKFARAYTKRSAVIAFEGAFHGRTLLSLSLTSKTHPYKAGLGPFAPEVYRVPFAQDYRGPDARTALRALEGALVTQVAAESVAAIVVEPVQGEGGFVPAPPDFLAGIRRICDDNGIVLVVDEVQTGFARTGKLFAIEHYDVEPDLITVAKSIAGGLPLSGVLGRATVMDAPDENAVGGTYVGNPVAQAAALAVLDVIEDEQLLERAAAIGETMWTRMRRWQDRFEQIGDVRGLGAMLALELVHDRASKDPAPELVAAICTRAFENGLLLLSAGVYSNVVRVLVPLTIPDAELDEALGVWEDALEHVLASI
jgi:4-aminobutyrate aminotransferase/(S)-3-amino-2-methylpropionate transaminase